MRNSRPVYLWTSVLLAVLFFLVLVFGVVRDYRYYFTSIDSAVLENDTVWGINTNGNETSVFQVSADTGNGSFLKIPIYENKRIVTVSDPFISDGQVYYRRTYRAEDCSYTEQLVYWDVEKNKLIECTDEKLIWEWRNNQIGSEASRTVFMSERTVMELDPPQGSRLEKKGCVQLAVWKDGKVKVLDCVQKKFAVVLWGIIRAILFSLLLFVALMITGNLASYYRVYPGLIVRIGIIALVTLMVVSPLVVQHLGWDLYSYAGKNVLMHCADSAYIHSYALNDELLKKFISGEEKFSAERMDELWKYNLHDDYSAEELQNTEVFNANKYYENRSNEQRAWDLYDDRVVDEESCIIYRKNGVLQFFYNDEVQSTPWLVKNSLIQKKCFSKAFASSEIQAFVTTIRNQRYAVALIPVETDTGARVLIGTRMSLANILVLFYHVRARALRILLILAGAFMILVLVGAYLALRPVPIMKEAIKGITEGDLTVRTHCRGFNELHYLARLFNAMMDRLEKQSEGTDSYRDFYDSFVPASLLRKLSGKSVYGAMHSGAVYQANACSMVINVQGDSEEKRNDLYESAIGAAESHGGHPAGFDSERLKLIYTEDTKAAFRAVTEFQQNLVGNQMHYVNVGMASSEVQLDVIGNDGRKNVTQRDSGEAEILSVIAAELNIPVILTEALYLDLVRTTSKFHFRCLGRIGAEGYEPDASLYELLDADYASVRAIKEYSRSTFEKGVKAYAAGDYFTARNDMIKVLRLDPDDLAAKCYILNCNRKEPPTVCQLMMQEN